MGASASRAQTSFSFQLKPTQPLAERRPRDAEAAAHCARVSNSAIRLDPAAPPAFRTILHVVQLSKSSTDADDGLWGCGQREALSIKSTACPIR